MLKTGMLRRPSEGLLVIKANPAPRLLGRYLIVFPAIQPHLLGTLHNLIDPHDTVLLNQFVVLLNHLPPEPNL